VSVLVIEINDSGLLAGGQAGCRQLGAGYALVEDGRILVGDAAREQARLRPRAVTNRFWRDFAVGASESAPVAPADLVCAQLGQVREQLGEAPVGDVIFTVPGLFGREALGMLLGVAREAGLAARGLVDSAVAATTHADHRSLMHLDLHLHMGVLTEIVAAEAFHRGEVQVAEGSGLAGLEQAWIATIAEAFVRQTRFDPLHHAATEQVLFENLWSWLEALGDRREIQIEIEAEDRRLSAVLSRAQLIHAVEPHYERLLRLVQGAQAARGVETALLARRTARLPGFSDRLLEIGLDVQTLDSAAALEGAAARSAHIVSGEESVRFVTSLPRLGHRSVATAPPNPAAADDRPQPTHLVQGSVAWAISETPLEIGVSPSSEHRPVAVQDKMEGVSRSHCLVYRKAGAVVVEDASRYGTWVNDIRVSGSMELRAGDELRVGSPGSRMLLVSARD